MATASYEDVMMLGTAQLINPGTGSSGTRGELGEEIIGKLANWTPPEFTQNVLEYVTRFSSNPIYLNLNPLQGQIAVQGYLRELSDYFRPFFGATPDVGTLPHMIIATPLITDDEVGHRGQLLIEECYGTLNGRAPQPRTPNAFGTVNYSMRIERYIAYREAYTFSAAGRWVLDSANSQKPTAPSALSDGQDLRDARYANPADAPDTYYDARLGYWFENGINIYQLRFLGTSLTALRSAARAGG